MKTIISILILTAFCLGLNAQDASGEKPAGDKQAGQKQAGGQKGTLWTIVKLDVEGNKATVKSMQGEQKDISLAGIKIWGADKTAITIKELKEGDRLGIMMNGENIKAVAVMTMGAKKKQDGSAQSPEKAQEDKKESK